MALDIYIDPTIGGYDTLDNRLAYVDVAINKVNVLLSMPIGSYIYAPTNGNPLLNEKGLIPSSQIVNDINTCLQPLIQSGELVNINVISQEISLGITQRYSIPIDITLPNGTINRITWIK